MKKFITLFMLVLALCLFVGCEKKPTPPGNTIDPAVDPNYDWSSEITQGYRVRVLYPNGEVVKEEIEVQWCTSQGCLRPVTTGDNGIAYNDISDGEYFVHIHEIPAGYDYNPNIYTQTTNRSMEIQLFAVSDIANNAISACGYYNTQLDSATDVKSYSFTAPEAGTYVIESFVTTNLATNLMDPLIVVGTSYDDNSGEGQNFKLELTLEANQTITFSIQQTKANPVVDTIYPDNFVFSILKK